MENIKDLSTENLNKLNENIDSLIDKSLQKIKLLLELKNAYNEEYSDATIIKRDDTYEPLLLVCKNNKEKYFFRNEIDLNSFIIKRKIYNVYRRKYLSFNNKKQIFEQI